MDIKIVQLLCSEHIILITHTHFILFFQTSLIQHLTHWPCLQPNIWCLFKYANKQLNTSFNAFSLGKQNLSRSDLSIFLIFWMECTTGLKKMPCGCQNKVTTISSRERLHFPGSTRLQQICCQSAHCDTATLP